MKQKIIEKKRKVKERGMNLEHETFCRVYTTRGETGGNATKSYAVAYEYEIPANSDGTTNTKSPEYAVCQAAGSRLMLNPRIQERIKELYLESLSERSVDSRLSEILHQGKDTDSIQAIKIFNDLKQRITKKVDVTTQGRPLAGMSDEELRELLGE